jgi:methylenetetrahydrofolate--tRNA-(uracil-5-)-methyltransferase
MFAGQITGVEGYIESASSGMVAGINMSRILAGLQPLAFPKTTAHGALCHYINDDTNKNFQPMNVNFGIFPELGVRIRNKAERYGKYAERALNDLDTFVKSF